MISDQKFCTISLFSEANEFWGFYFQIFGWREDKISEIMEITASCEIWNYINNLLRISTTVFKLFAQDFATQ